MDASLGLLIEKLKQLEADLIRGAEDELGLLDGELTMLKGLLEDASRIYKKDDNFNKWLSQISTVVENIKDTIINCNTRIASNSESTWIKKFEDDTPLAEKVRILRLDSVKPLFDMFKDSKFYFDVTPDAPIRMVTDAANTVIPHVSITTVPGTAVPNAHEVIITNTVIPVASSMVLANTVVPDAPNMIIADPVIPDAPDMIIADMVVPDAPDTIIVDMVIPDAPETIIANPVILDAPDTIVPNAADTNVSHASSELPQVVNPMEERNIVGFEDEMTVLNGYLIEKNDKLDVISIVGMPGVGKTTLAQMIFNNRSIRYEFDKCIWVYISQEFNRRGVFLQILRCLDTSIDDMEKKSDLELGDTVHKYLIGRRFLIVVDDLWSVRHWDELRRHLPIPGKVLITTRIEDVASYTSSRVPHRIRLLSIVESWELLKLKAFGNKVFPSELEEVGMRIAGECRGLPLAIVVIGSRLASVGFSMEKWESVSQNVGASLTSGDSYNTMETIIALSYDKLPYHLKACFLYLGVFPEDCVIPARILTRMWLAEGFVEHEDGLSYEKTAERYLDELIGQSLILPDKVGRDGKVKTCRVHDIIRDFCRSESEKEKSLQHRHCIHADILKFLSTVPDSPVVRSFVSFPDEEVLLTKAAASAIPSAYKQLRLLESKSLIFSSFPSNMFQLIHLRYITLSLARVDILPRGFSKLSNPQTLIVHTKSDTLEVKADIWEMTQLRHFETNASATLPRKGKSTSETQLQTLGSISPESLTEEVIQKMCNVKKLSIRGKVAVLLGSKNVPFHYLGMLAQLEKLKMLNDASLSQGRLPKPLSAFMFPMTLKSLTLSKTFFVWGDMTILGSHPNLRILKLKEKAFVGEIWKLVDDEFQSLEVLQIQGLDFADWIMSSDPFPRLRQLELRACKNLKWVPIELVEIFNLEVLELYHCEAAVASVMELKKMMAAWGSKLQVSISPPPPHPHDT